MKSVDQAPLCIGKSASNDVLVDHDGIHVTPASGQPLRPDYPLFAVGIKLNHCGNTCFSAVNLGVSSHHKEGPPRCHIDCFITRAWQIWSPPPGPGGNIKYLGENVSIRSSSHNSLLGVSIFVVNKTANSKLKSSLLWIFSFPLKISSLLCPSAILDHPGLIVDKELFILSQTKKAVAKHIGGNFTLWLSELVYPIVVVRCPGACTVSSSHDPIVPQGRIANKHSAVVIGKEVKWYALRPCAVTSKKAEADVCWTQCTNHWLAVPVQQAKGSKCTGGNRVDGWACPFLASEVDQFRIVCGATGHKKQAQVRRSLRSAYQRENGNQLYLEFNTLTWNLLT